METDLQDMGQVNRGAGQVRGRMGEAARRRMGERYSVKRMVEEYVAVYKEVLGIGKVGADNKGHDDHT